MIINILLLALLFGMGKKKLKPMAGGAAYGAIKAVLYYIGTQSMIAAGFAFIVFGALCVILIFLVDRLNRMEATDEPYSKYGAKPRSSFKWEYIPVSCIVLLLIFGEMMANLLFAPS